MIIVFYIKEHERMVKMEITCVNKQDKMVVFIAGEIDHHSCIEARDAVDRLMAKFRPAVLIMDLSGIDFMDSSGLGLVLGRYRKMCDYGGEMLISNPCERVGKILKMAGVDRIIKTASNDRVSQITCED